MYNEDHKKAYLDTLKPSPGKKNIESFMNCVAEAEESLNKDIAQFTKDELISYYSQAEFCNPSYVVEQLKILRKYRIWYNENVEHCVISVVSSDLADEIDSSEAIKKNLFFSLDELIDTLEDLSDIYDLTDICSYILSWYQVKLNKSVELKKTDVRDDGDLVSIHLHDRVLKISHVRAAGLIKKYRDTVVMEREFTANKGDYEENNSVYFIRSFKKEPSKKAAPVSASAIQQRRNDRAKMFGISDIDYRNVMLSGELCMVSDAVKNGFDPKDALRKIHPKFENNKIEDRYHLYVQFEKAKERR